MPTVIAVPPGDPTCNSFLTVAEAQAYWDTRLYSDGWDGSPDQPAAVILATRTICSLLSPRRIFVPTGQGTIVPYFIVRPTWTGLIASQTQALPWPRSGMYDRNGIAIPETIIPHELKEATAELAGQMSVADRMIDNDVAVQGITAVRAGSVSVNFQQPVLTLKVIPDSVLDLLVPSWLTDQVLEPAFAAEFDVI